MKNKFLLNSLLILPLLALSFTVAAQTTLSVRINSANDDLEEWIPGSGQTKMVGTLDDGSSDLEFGTESSGGDPQLVGLRFTNITIPKGAIIAKAYIQFTVDAISKNSDPCKVIIKGEANDNPSAFNPADTFNLSKRPKTGDSAVWTVSGSSWGTIGSAGTDQRTTDIKTIIQSLVNRSGWASGNAIALYMYGTGTREVESYDGDAPKAPLLVIEYWVPVTVSIRVNSANDDLEEWIPGTGQTKMVGTLDDGSSDLEFGTESSGGDPQLVGMRFTNITIPKGAPINKAYIQFTVDAVSKNSDPCVVVIKGEAADNPSTFNPADTFNLTKRQKTSDSAVWTVSGSSWGTIGSAGVDQRTTDLSTIVQGLVNRTGWASGNSMALYMYGTGTREVESYDGDAPKAAQLVIEYLSATAPTPPVNVNPTTAYPVTKNGSWSYWDKENKPAGNWKDTTYNDSTWAYGNAALGFGESGLGKTISAGSAGKKITTAYFRKRFTIANLTSNLTDTVELNLRADDGAVVYLNGNELLRRNMPSGTIDSNTKAVVRQEGVIEQVYFLYDLPRSLFVTGTNTLAVEVHQYDTTDLVFGLELKNRLYKSNPAGLMCTGGTDGHISCFTSLLPTPQYDTMAIPSTHAFQQIFRQGSTYTKGGTVPGAHDFTAYVGKNGSSRNGWLAVNHETSPMGGVSVVDLHFDCATGIWVADSSQAVDFTTDIVKTERNCSGGITPWGTVVTSEESLGSGDANADGYQDIGWHVEIDPATKKVKEYGNNKREKLWAMGRISHENVCFSNDSVTAYYGEDDGSSNLFKFVASQKKNLYTGTLYVLKLDSGLNSAGDPKASAGVWVQVPNTTVSDRNNTKSLAASLGGTMFNGIEDAEIGTVDGKIYFTAKGNNRTYRFTDNGTTVSNFQTFVGGTSYRINYGGGVISEDWGSGNDNLTFDDRGNLWVLQDGGRNHVWVVRPNHTQANPQVELFMITPTGSEPTGMTFSPDYKYMFISIQSPSGNIDQKDVTGTNVKFNQSTALVIARKESFKTPLPRAGFTASSTTQCLNGNSFTFTDTTTGNTSRAWSFGNGNTSVNAANTLSYTSAGNYTVKLTTTNAVGCVDSAKKTITVNPKPASLSITGPLISKMGKTENYNVQNNAGSSYTWMIVNGTQTAGGSSANATVQWSNQPTGQVKVFETASTLCKGDTATANISLSPDAVEDVLIPGLKIYPNPASQFLNLSSDEAVAYTVYDLSGKVLINGNKEAGSDIHINVAELPSGSYLLKVKGKDHEVTKQFIKN